MQNNNTEPNKRPFLYPNESYLIRGACFEVYKIFRDTQKESIYQKSLEAELKNQGLNAVREQQMPVYYLGKKVGVYTPDIIVNDQILLELKTKPALIKEDIQQFWYYLKNSRYKLGFLINFGEANGVKIIRRIYNPPNRSVSD